MLSRRTGLKVFNYITQRMQMLTNRIRKRIHILLHVIHNHSDETVNVIAYINIFHLQRKQ